jgi:hypothetical protein
MGGLGRRGDKGMAMIVVIEHGIGGNVLFAVVSEPNTNFGVVPFSEASVLKGQQGSMSNVLPEMRPPRMHEIVRDEPSEKTHFSFARSATRLFRSRWGNLDHV